MKSYCTQNNGDCATCSLSSYGRDCKNNRGDDWAITVSGGCPTFVGPELIDVLPHYQTHAHAKARTAELERETGRIMYLCKICDL